MASQDIIRRSGTADITPAAHARIGAVQHVTKLFDATKCTGCKVVRLPVQSGTTCVKTLVLSRAVTRIL